MTQATIVASVIIANIGALIGAFISLKISTAKLEFLVDSLSKDVDALGTKLREIERGD